ncbi:hypothetical protein M3Y98_00935500 [Aphelenchoides besseyi]|nr:hypothetical protein M3Y98_00935500 [Aphelenchoides besseyi]
MIVVIHLCLGNKVVARERPTQFEGAGSRNKSVTTLRICGAFEKISMAKNHPTRRDEKTGRRPSNYTANHEDIEIVDGVDVKESKMLDFAFESTKQKTNDEEDVSRVMMPTIRSRGSISHSAVGLNGENDVLEAPKSAPLTSTTPPAANAIFRLGGRLRSLVYKRETAYATHEIHAATATRRKSHANSNEFSAIPGESSQLCASEDEVFDAKPSVVAASTNWDPKGMGRPPSISRISSVGPPSPSSRVGDSKKNPSDSVRTAKFELSENVCMKNNNK